MFIELIQYFWFLNMFKVDYVCEHIRSYKIFEYIGNNQQTYDNAFFIQGLRLRLWLLIIVNSVNHYLVADKS